MVYAFQPLQAKNHNGPLTFKLNASLYGCFYFQAMALNAGFAGFEALFSTVYDLVDSHWAEKSSKDFFQ